MITFDTTHVPAVVDQFFVSSYLFILFYSSPIHTQLCGFDQMFEFFHSVAAPHV